MNTLSDDYIISVEKMLSMPEAHRSDTWLLDTTEFMDSNGEFQDKDVLLHVDGDKQIFAMKNGDYILEVEISHGGNVEYFIDRDLNKLKSV